MSTKLHFIITGGPTDYQLVDALKYAYDKDNPHKVVFTMRKSDEKHTDNISEPLPSDIRRPVTITALEHEDGSGYSFILKGFMSILPHESRYSTLYGISGCYNTKTNKGYLNAE
jgi:hypothetical protein